LTIVVLPLPLGARITPDFLLSMMSNAKSIIWRWCASGSKPRTYSMYASGSVLARAFWA
jgi:hypothetical protein